MLSVLFDKVSLALITFINNRCEKLEMATQKSNTIYLILKIFVNYDIIF